MNGDSQPVAQAVAAGPGRGPWGPGMTFLFGFVLFIAYSGVQAVAVVPWVLVRSAAGARGPDLMAAAMSGLNLAFATIAACPFMLLACGLLVLARRGPSLGDYLALNPVRIRVVFRWVLLIVVVGSALSGLNDLMERKPPEFLTSTYASAGHLPWFWGGVGICAPLAEEVLFRGFLFPGLVRSGLRSAGTVLVTAVLFSVVHAGQYDWVDLVEVGLAGLLMGWGRVSSGSLVVPVAMHVALNLVALTFYHFESRAGL